MRRSYTQKYCIPAGLLLAWTVSICPTFASPQRIRINSVRLLPATDGESIEIQSDRPFAFVTYTLSDPDRLVLDPVEEGVEGEPALTGSSRGGLVRGWRTLAPAGESSSSAVDYLEFQLAEPAEHRVEPVAGGLMLHLRSKQAAASLPPTRGEEISALRQPALFPDLDPSPVSPLNDPEPDLWTLPEALKFGLGHHRSARVAREEVELAQMKMREARRALYPAATLRFSWTEGIASEINFTEYNSGLQLEQPLFYSGRLMETYRQSLVNLQVSEKRQGKVKADYAEELSQNYYQYIGTRMSLEAQEDLAREADQFLQRSQKRFQEGLLTRLELLNVEAQLNQARFQRATAENDILLARVKFLQKLGVEREGWVGVPDDLAMPSDRRIDLEEALELAMRYKPDVQVNRLLVQFHEFEERIARAKGKWKVDLSGFIGVSAAAFETETLNPGEDYFVGVKASRVWGPHGTNASVTTTKTSPQLGQTTRTDSTVYSAEMGIMDQLAGLSEVKQAQVNLQKAKRDLEEARDSTSQEVQEAFIGYQKALLQLDYSRQKIAFREEQVKILQAQASLNEALPSQVLEAVMKVSEERIARAQALSNYYVALARLNKAIGLPGHFQ